MIQIYTGEGKGKTTASIGLAVRASKHFKVLFTQFIKNGESSEIGVLKSLPSIDAKSFGNGDWILPDSDKSIEKKNAHSAVKYVRGNFAGYDVIILDEAVTAVDLGLISEDEILELLSEISENKEIIMTGRGATKKMIERADLVTEMKKIKHYYEKGVKARKGIEL